MYLQTVYSKSKKLSSSKNKRKKKDKQKQREQARQKGKWEGVSYSAGCLAIYQKKISERCLTRMCK